MNRSRFSSSVWFEQVKEKNVIIGGAGGIGSWTALLLTRAGFKPIVYDFDVYEEVNTAGQFVSINGINKPKVISLTENIRLFTGETITGIQQKYTNESMYAPLMIAGFDNIQARRDMYFNWKKQLSLVESKDQLKQYLFIDGRLLAEQYQIICICGDNNKAMEEYETDKFLFSDSEIEQVVCSLKQTTHCATMIASKITSFMINHLSNLAEDNQGRSVPFYYEELLPINFINETNL